MQKKRSKVPAGLLKSRIISIGLFFIFLLFFTILGLILLLRPSVSTMENRELARFPEFSMGRVLNGSYFSDISEWYSDTYPLRDFWMAGNDAFKRTYGVRTTRIIQGDAAKDDIPDVLDLGNGTGAGTAEDGISKNSGTNGETVISEISPDDQNASNTGPADNNGLLPDDPGSAVSADQSSTAPDGQGGMAPDSQGSTAPDSQGSMAPDSQGSKAPDSQGGMAPDSQTDPAPADTGGTEINGTEIAAVPDNAPVQAPDTGTDVQAGQAAGLLPRITAQTQNGLYVNGDSAFGIYYFNKTAAATFVNAVNRLAKQFEGRTNVYCMLVPLSASFYLTPETLASTDGSDERQAMNTYYNSMDPLVRKIDIYDTLEAHKGEYIYFRTDHHWTNLGAYYSYRVFAGMKGITPHELSDYEVMEFPGFLGQYYTLCKSADMEANPDTITARVPVTYNRMVYENPDNGESISWPIINDVSGYRATQKYSCFSAGDNPFSYIENPNVQNGQSCVLIKESYADAFIPFLTDHYQYIYWFDYRYYQNRQGTIVSFLNDHYITDLIFVNGMEPISSVESMERLDALLQ